MACRPARCTTRMLRHEAARPREGSEAFPREAARWTTRARQRPPQKEKTSYSRARSPTFRATFDDEIYHAIPRLHHHARVSSQSTQFSFGHFFLSLRPPPPCCETYKRSRLLVLQKDLFSSHHFIFFCFRFCFVSIIFLFSKVCFVLNSILIVIFFVYSLVYCHFSFVMFVFFFVSILLYFVSVSFNVLFMFYISFTILFFYFASLFVPYFLIILLSHLFIFINFHFLSLCSCFTCLICLRFSFVM